MTDFEIMDVKNVSCLLVILNAESQIYL